MSITGIWFRGKINLSNLSLGGELRCILRNGRTEGPATSVHSRLGDGINLHVRLINDISPPNLNFVQTTNLNSIA